MTFIPEPASGPRAGTWILNIGRLSFVLVFFVPDRTGTALTWVVALLEDGEDADPGQPGSAVLVLSMEPGSAPGL